MTMSLWILVDISGRILYTGATKEIVEGSFEFKRFKDAHVIELKGEINV